METIAERVFFHLFSWSAGGGSLPRSGHGPNPTAVRALDSIQVQNPEVHWACDASDCFYHTLDPKQTSHGSHLLNKIVRIINSNDVSA